MCEWTIAATALSTVASAVGQIRQGREQAALYRYQASLADRRAQIAQQQAQAEAERTREEGQALLGRQRAGFAKSGVAISGTPLDVLGATAKATERAALDEIRAGALEAAEQRARAGSLSFRAATVGPRAALGAGTSLLSGTSRVLSRSEPWFGR